MKKVTTQIQDKNGKFVTIRAYVDNETAKILSTFSEDERHQYIVDEHFGVHLNNRRETENHISLDSCLDSGGDFADESLDMDADLDKKILYAKLHEAVKTLNNKQRWLITQVYIKNRSKMDIARQLGINYSSLRDQFRIIYKKIKKFLEK